jgi:hypothetical protein
VTASKAVAALCGARWHVHSAKSAALVALQQLTVLQMRLPQKQCAVRTVFTLLVSWLATWKSSGILQRQHAGLMFFGRCDCRSRVCT